MILIERVQQILAEDGKELRSSQVEALAKAVEEELKQIWDAIYRRDGMIYY